MKKVIALFLAMLMCMALAVSAMADGVSIASGGDISDGQALEFDVKLQQPVIKVTVPPAAQTLVLNPYNIKLTSSNAGIASGDTAFGTSVGSGGKNFSVLAAKLYLKNESNVPLKVSLTATGKVEGGKVTFSTAPVTEKETTKKVFLFVDVGTRESVKSGDPANLPAALSDATYASSNKNQAVVKAGDVKLTDVLTLRTPISMGTTVDSNYVAIQVGGNCTTTPAEQWTENDKVSLKLVFSFQATNNNDTNNQ